MKKIYFNVTSSFEWKGAPVGIVRTESRLFDFFQKNESIELKLFIVRNRKIIPITKEEYLSKQLKSSLKLFQLSGKEIESNLNTPVKFLFPILSKKEAVKNLMQSSLSLTPSLLRPFYNGLLTYLFHTYAKIKKREINKLSVETNRIELRSPNSTKESLEYDDTFFTENGIIFSCGLDWNISDFFQRLRSIKNKKKIKIVSFCHDLIPVYFPHFCASNTVPQYTKYFLSLLDASDLVCCNSYSTEGDLKRFADDHDKRLKTCVTYLGADVGNRSEKTEIDVVLTPDLDFNTPFILYVSTIDRRKNHEILYRAYSRLISEGKGKNLPVLYFVGMVGWGVQDFLRDLDLDPLVKDKIKLLGRINDVQLDLLYQKCKFVVFPSRYEGWGLAVGEALSHGKFVLCSDKGALPEAGQAFAEYIDPDRPDLWAERILYYTEHEEKLKEKESHISKSWSPILWDDTARNIIDCFNSLG